MEFTTLSNGVKAPLLGVGTYLLSLEDTEKSVYEAIRCGYRLIDTANGYLNEAAVGRAVARAINEGLSSAKSSSFRQSSGRRCTKRKRPLTKR
ncbi:hypothetical protein [Mitsuokella sp.]|uniref:hypothetical protein n=1 Tax=Mitsuokella sp. TaxID=2049034 RepID=UPI003D7CEFAD